MDVVKHVARAPIHQYQLENTDTASSHQPQPEHTDANKDTASSHQPQPEHTDANRDTASSHQPQPEHTDANKDTASSHQPQPEHTDANKDTASSHQPQPEYTDANRDTASSHQPQPEHTDPNVDTHLYTTKQGVPENPKEKVVFSSYDEAVKSRASKDRIIFLAFADLGAKSMALNFYITSLNKHKITNYLFISSSEVLCNSLHSHNIPCFLFTNDSASNKESVYLSKDFLRKMNIRSSMIIEALQKGYNVIHTDVDMYYFKDPLPSIKAQCNSSCDIAPLWDHKAYNAGFLFIRSTQKAIDLYKRAREFANETKLDDQLSLNTAVKEFKNKSLNVQKLNESEFVCGLHYFEDGNRTFAGDNPCKTCIVVHNNWMVTNEAKVYRFKELHMWMNDEGRYYSDPNRKYLSYENPAYFVNDTETWKHERNALKSALAIGTVLNRTVILPRFWCAKKPECTILNKTKLADFHNEFSDIYRENTFLRHPLVPESVKSSQSKLYLIQTDEPHTKDMDNVKDKLKPASEAASEEEIVHWFSGVKESVLRFHSLYNAFKKFSNRLKMEHFKSKCNSAFKPTGRRQF